VNIKGGESARTPLHMAVLKNDAASVELLLNAGADVKAEDKNGLTPLNYTKNENIIKMLSSPINQTASQVSSQV